MRVPLGLLALTTLLLAPSSVSAWGRDGHRAVCLIAWDAIDDPSRQQIKNLLDIETREQFADDCNWADDIRRDRGETASWHFMDASPGKDIHMGRDCPANKCVVGQIERTTALLRGPASKQEKAEALKFLAHFVGDLHQPLHIAVAGDQGGNNIRVRFQGKLTNLHSVWDSRILEAGSMVGEDGVTSILRDAAKAKGPNRRASQDPMVWARETHRIALAPATAYVGAPAELDLDDNYIRQNYPVAIQQIKRAGIRLGRLLRAVLPRQAIVFTP